MLESISWENFLTTVAVLLGGYYAITILLLYGREITSLFKQRIPGQTKATDQDASTKSDDLMGGVRYQRSEEQITIREEVSTAEELQVSSHEQEEPITAVDLLEESLANEFIVIQAEINSLVEIAANDTKEKGVSLFKTLLSNYPQFIGTPYQQQISQLICDLCNENNTHHYDLPEINSWWTDPATTSNNHQ